MRGTNMQYNIEQDFLELCYDCLYYGYLKKFIFENYTNFINELGKEKAEKIYQKAFNKICNK